MAARLPIRLVVNGESVAAAVEPRQHLIDFLREACALSGARVSCEHGVCGACTVRLNGEIVRGCLVLAVQANGAEIETIEGATARGAVADLQAAFVSLNALQCGFCTPGMVLAADDLLRRNPAPTREEARAFLSGNYCRCTGYHAIVDAVMRAAAMRRGEQP